MPTKNHAILFTLIVALTVVFSSCKQRYGYIPRALSFNKKASQETKKKGFTHYVKVDTDQHHDSLVVIEPKALDDTAVVLAKQPPVSSILESKLDIPEANRVASRSFTSIDSSNTSKKPDPEIKKLYKGSGFLLAVVSLLNIAMLFTPYYNYMVIGVLFMLGLVVLGYFVSKLIKNIAKNKMNPGRLRYYTFRESRQRMKRAVGIIFAVSGSFFSLSLLALAASLFDLSFFLAVIGLISFYAALLAGLIYLFMGLY